MLARQLRPAQSMTDHSLPDNAPDCADTWHEACYHTAARVRGYIVHRPGNDDGAEGDETGESQEAGGISAVR